MTKSRIIAIAASVTALLLALALLVSLFVTPDEPNRDYSPIPVSPTADDPSEPTVADKPVNLDSLELAYGAVLDNLSSLETSFADRVDRAFLDKMCAQLGADAVEKLANALEKGVVTTESLRSVIGYTEKAFLTLVENDLSRTEVIKNTENGATDMVFVGDVSFADGYSVMIAYNNRKKGVEGIVSTEVLNIMRNADITMANNEFTFTTRGTPQPGKKFTFRGNPENAKIYHEMGVDIVSLANNHAFDYGAVSLTDTLAALDAEGINRLGAGENIDEATSHFYYIVNGYKIAFVASSSLDPESTRGATETLSGVFQSFASAPMVREIEKAKENADYVVAYVHWGRENTLDLHPTQLTMGKDFVDAGADVVVGMHSHCMQGAEYYKGKLIVYSLGNFTFSSKSLTCAMLKMSISDDGKIENTFYPMMQTGNFTSINSGDSGKEQLSLLRSLLINAKISDDFVITPTAKGE